LFTTTKNHVRSFPPAKSTNKNKQAINRKRNGYKQSIAKGQQGKDEQTNKDRRRRKRERKIHSLLFLSVELVDIARGVRCFPLLLFFL
jgi:hypothetical protein